MLEYMVRKAVVHIYRIVKVRVRLQHVLVVFPKACFSVNRRSNNMRTWQGKHSELTPDESANIEPSRATRDEVDIEPIAAFAL